ncbi:Os11g0303300, partial [Oryza sativa Japonica Group]
KPKGLLFITLVIAPESDRRSIGSNAIISIVQAQRRSRADRNGSIRSGSKHVGPDRRRDAANAGRAVAPHPLLPHLHDSPVRRPPRHPHRHPPPRRRRLAARPRHRAVPPHGQAPLPPPPHAAAGPLRHLRLRRCRDDVPSHPGLLLPRGRRRRRRARRRRPPQPGAPRARLDVEALPRHRGGARRLVQGGLPGSVAAVAVRARPRRDTSREHSEAWPGGCGAVPGRPEGVRRLRVRRGSPGVPRRVRRRRVADRLRRRRRHGGEGHRRGLPARQVLDLARVVGDVPADGVVEYVAGDMFDFIPPSCTIGATRTA